MRSLAFIAFGSLVLSTSLGAQSLTEHAAAAAGATIGTAAGKPLGTALGKIFGSMDQSTSKAAAAKPKPAPTKPAATATAPAVAPAPAALSSGGSVAGASGGSSGGSFGGSGTSASARHTSRHREEPDAEPLPLAPIAPITPVVPEPVKEPSVEEIAAIKVGATSTELNASLGAPESRVSIPGDDGHLLEICQYWAKGQALGTVRLDNGRVVSVETRAY